MARVSRNPSKGVPHSVHRTFKRLDEVALDRDQQSGQAIIPIIRDRALNDPVDEVIKIGGYRERLAAAINKTKEWARGGLMRVSAGEPAP